MFSFLTDGRLTCAALRKMANAMPVATDYKASGALLVFVDSIMEM